jgi:hypothetical protein
VCHCSEHETLSTKEKSSNDTEEINILHTCRNTDELTIENIFGKIGLNNNDLNTHNDT